MSPYYLHMGNVWGILSYWGFMQRGAFKRCDYIQGDDIWMLNDESVKSPRAFSLCNQRSQNALYHFNWKGFSYCMVVAWLMIIVLFVKRHQFSQTVSHVSSKIVCDWHLVKVWVSWLKSTHTKWIQAIISLRFLLTCSTPVKM